MPGKHARLAPSAASRWMACPGSVRLSEGIVERPSAFAQEGIDAHNEAAICLAHKRNSKNEDIQQYVDFVRKQANGSKLKVEQRVDLSRWILSGFGTADAVVIHEDKFQVIDLKFGKGVKVDAQNNPQLRLYALGVYGELELCYRFLSIETIIVQPRLDHLSSEKISPEELLSFGDLVRDRAQKTMAKDAPLFPGEIQCRWCPARYTCKVRAEHQLALAEETFRFLPSTFCHPEMLGDAEVAALLPHLDGLKKWASELQEWALEKALRGEQVPGHKLVAGRAVRRWAPGAEELLKELMPEDKLYKKKLVGIGAVEKELGKKHPVLDAATIRPAGKPALVTENDPRPVYSSAAADFEPVKV